MGKIAAISDVELIRHAKELQRDKGEEGIVQYVIDYDRPIIVDGKLIENP